MHKLLPILILLTACGGGGGGGSPAPPAPPTPRAVDDSATIDEDGTATINVLSNDVSVTSSTLALGNAPDNGSATINDGAIDYVPDADFAGSGSFTYTVDSTAGNELTATVSITVTEVNDNPIANDDMISLTEDTPTAFDVTSNDTDVDNAIESVSVVSGPDNGAVTLDNALIIYTPNQDYVGTDQLTYRAIDANEGESNTATVSIDVLAITETNLTITNLPVPTDNYTAINHPDYETPVLSSPAQTLSIPPNAVSFSLTLRGSNVDEAIDALFISDLQSPAGDITTFRNLYGFCDQGLCASLVPRRPDIKATRGEWQFRLGTLDSTLENIDLEELTLDVAVRTGPQPQSTTITIKPYLAGTGIDTTELDTILDRLVTIANDNQIGINLLPITEFNDPRFAEISADFNDPVTGEMVSMGDSDTVNVFFVDSFAGPTGGSILGIASGIPGTQGLASSFNGVLINTLALHDGPKEFYVRNTAQLSFHEMGHFLGLYHTTEGDFSVNDVLDDTPNCTQLDDANDNGLADITECPDGTNPMFWKPDLLNTMELTTPHQQQIIFYAPIAKP